MTTLTVTVSDHTRAFLEEQAAEEGFASPGEYVQSLIRQEELRRAKQDFEARIREGMDSPGREMTRADRDHLKWRARGRGADARGAG